MNSTTSSAGRPPKAAVIVTAYNMEKFIEQTVQSVVHQTFRDWEMLVIDDGSRDRTAEIVHPYTQKYPRVRLITVENGGVCRARDRGAELASAEYILFLDGDDFLDENCLNILVGELDANPNAVGSYGLPRAIDEHDKFICNDLDTAYGSRRKKLRGEKRVTVADSEPTTLEMLCIWDFISTPGQVLIRKSVFDKTGGHCDELPHSEDWDLWLRLCLVGDLIYVRKFVMTKRERVNSRSKHWPSMALAEPMIRKRLASKIPMSAEQRRTARRAHLHSCLYKLTWASGSMKSGGAVAGLKQVYRAGRSYIQYLKTSYDFVNVA